MDSSSEDVMAAVTFLLGLMKKKCQKHLCTYIGLTVHKYMHIATYVCTHTCIFCVHNMLLSAGDCYFFLFQWDLPWRVAVAGKKKTLTGQTSCNIAGIGPAVGAGSKISCVNSPLEVLEVELIYLGTCNGRTVFMLCHKTLKNLLSVCDFRFPAGYVEFQYE